MDLSTICSFVVVATLWGTTNAFMEVGTAKPLEKKKEESSSLLSGLGNLFANWRFLVPFGLNQLASVLNNFIIAGNDLSIAVPSVNCLTFIVTFITQRILKKETLIDGRFFLGVVLISIGMYLCLDK